MSRKSKHSPEVRAGAVKMVLEDKRTPSDVAEALGVSLSALNYWLQVARKKAAPPPVSADERAELLRLRAEVKDLKEDNLILKKAAAFFAKNSS